MTWKASTCILSTQIPDGMIDESDQIQRNTLDWIRQCICRFINNKNTIFLQWDGEEEGRGEGSAGGPVRLQEEEGIHDPRKEEEAQGKASFAFSISRSYTKRVKGLLFRESNGIQITALSAQPTNRT